MACEPCLDQLWNSLVCYENPLEKHYSRGNYVRLVNSEDLPPFEVEIPGSSRKDTLPRRIYWRLSFVNCICNANAFFERGKDRAVDVDSLRGECLKIEYEELDKFRLYPDAKHVALNYVALNYMPIPVVSDDLSRFNIDRLRASLIFLNKISSPRKILNMPIRINGVRPQSDKYEYGKEPYYIPCLELAASLSINLDIIYFWDASIHAPRGSNLPEGFYRTQKEPVYLMLRRLPGTPLLNTASKAPKGIPWKKVNLKDYDDWLFVYSPETEEEILAHDARVALLAKAALEKEEASLSSV